MNIQNAYNEWSDTYDADENRTRDLDQEVTRHRLSGLQFESILEVGCGTGKNTSFFAQLGRQLYAVDFSEGMIARAREKVRADHVHFSTMDISSPWKFENESFELIICNLVLEHVQDLKPIFSEAARTLRSNGTFFINELHPFRQYEGTRARFYRAEKKIEVQAFLHHISDFLKAAAASHLSLIDLDEYWHETDQNKSPRLLSLTFAKG